MAATAVATLALLVFVAGPVRVDGASMRPTLADGDLLVATRAEVWLARSGAWRYRRGDVVHFTDPSASAPFGPQIVKRVVGVGGDVVAVEDGRLVLNGAPTFEPYLGAHPVPGADAAPVLVPPGSVYVLGDNRAPLASRDSRAFGPIPVDRIWGRVGVRIAVGDGALPRFVRVR